MKSLRNWPLTYGEPNWVPLEAALAPEQREDYMYMGRLGRSSSISTGGRDATSTSGWTDPPFSGTPMRVMKRLTARTPWTSHVLKSGKEQAMAKGINKTMLLGHVGKDPEIRSTTGGTLVATFSLATADRQKDGQGNWSDRTEWHNLVAFNRTAEVIRDYVKKGTQLFIEGRIQTRSWDDKATGEKQYRTEVLINDLTLLGGKPNQDSGGSSSGNGAKSTGSSASGGYGRTATSAVENYTDQGISDDDIPF